MNIYAIKDALPAVEEIGYTLDAPERMRLEMGLIRLTSIADADQLLFWGKIFTNSEPYYIAMGIDFEGCYGFPHKRFYYSRNNLIFQELPPLDEFNKQKVNDFANQPFTGDPATIIINIQGQQNQQNKENQNQAQNQDSDQEEAKKIQPKNYTQLDRLSYTVRAIENQCQLAPKGAFKISVQHQLRYNENFKGLNSPEILLSHFQHFRYPIAQQAVKKIEDPKSVLTFDFLEDVDNPSHWTVQTTTDREFVTVRNFAWSGYVGYHRLKSKVFGGVYFGSGVKKTDISFYV